jgi:hypothetical protein
MLTGEYTFLFGVNKKLTKCRWVYRRMYVADGNFKADHVRQARSEDELWLWDGAGMMPNRREYMDFIVSAVEQSTVGDSGCINRRVEPLLFRRHHAKIISRQSSNLC